MCTCREKAAQQRVEFYWGQKCFILFLLCDDTLPLNIISSCAMKLMNVSGESAKCCVKAVFLSDTLSHHGLFAVAS